MTNEWIIRFEKQNPYVLVAGQAIENEDAEFAQVYATLALAYQMWRQADAR